MPGKFVAPRNRDSQPSIAWLLPVLVGSAFVIEVLVMLLLGARPPQPDIASALLDAALLSILLFPIFYFFAFRPLQLHIAKRRQAEQALEANEESWKSALEGSGNGVSEWTPQTGKVIFSRSYMEMLGYSEGESWNSLDDWKNRIRQEDISRVMMELKAFMDGRIKTCSVEYRMRCKDESWKWILVRGMVVRNAADGTPQRMVGTHTDVTGHKQLEIQRAQFSKFFNLAIDMQCIAGQDGHLKKVNPAFTRTLGYSESELLARPYIEFIVPEDRQPTLHEVEKQLWGGTTLKFVNRYVCKDGSIRWLSWNAFANPDDGMLYATARDITEQKRAAEALFQSENQLRLLLDSAAEAIYGTDMQGNCTFCNPACLRLLGYKHADELTGKNMHELIHHKRQNGAPYPEEECRIYQAFRNGEPTHADDEVLWRGGGARLPAR